MTPADRGAPVTARRKKKSHWSTPKRSTWKGRGKQRPFPGEKETLLNRPKKKKKTALSSAGGKKDTRKKKSKKRVARRKRSRKSPSQTRQKEITRPWNPGRGKQLQEGKEEKAPL